MTSIAIVGSGVSGLHLGLFLQQHDVPVTIYSDRSAAQIASGRLPNTVAHHHHTLQRERELGVHHWDAGEYGYVCHQHAVLGTPEPMRWRGDFQHPSSIIDYRLYLPRLLEDYEERGGDLVIGPIEAEQIERIGADHDLVVVAAGRGMGPMFAPIPAKCPYDKPQRRLSAGIYHGVRYSEPKGVGVHMSLGHGELLELPITSREGFATALLFENIPGGDLEVLADISYEEDPRKHDETVLRKLEAHYPMCFERVDPAEFRLQGPTDLLQGALTPVVREDYARLDGGTFALAMGDAHCVVDPVNGQGANSASHSAWVIGHAILEDLAFDEQFCRRVARDRQAFVYGVSDWTNMILNPEPHVVGLLMAMAQNKALCDAYTENFNHPDRQWDTVATAERSAAFIARHTAGQPAVAAPVDPEWEVPQPMHKLVVLYPPPADKEKFRSYYVETHVPLAAGLPGLRAYRYAFNLEAPAGDTPYWCIFEAEFDDAAAMGASMQSEHGAKVTADVPNYADQPPVMLHYEVTEGG